MTTPAQPPAEQGKTPKTDALALHLRLVAHDHEKGTITEAEVNERVAAALSEVEDMERSLAALAADKERLREAQDCLGILIATVADDGLTRKLMTPEFQLRCLNVLCASADTDREQGKGVGAFWQMSEEEQVEALIHVIEFEPTNELMAKAVLARIQQGARP